jgi:hypothetical protein
MPPVPCLPADAILKFLQMISSPASPNLARIRNAIFDIVLRRRTVSNAPPFPTDVYSGTMYTLNKHTIFSIGMITTNLLTSHENETFFQAWQKMTNVGRSMFHIAIFLTLDNTSNSNLIEKEFITFLKE